MTATEHFDARQPAGETEHHDRLCDGDAARGYSTRRGEVCKPLRDRSPESSAAHAGESIVLSFQTCQEPVIMSQMPSSSSSSDLPEPGTTETRARKTFRTEAVVEGLLKKRKPVAKFIEEALLECGLMLSVDLPRIQERHPS